MNYTALKISILLVGFFVMVLLITLALIFTKDYDVIGDDLIYKISTIPIAKNMQDIAHVSYTPNNKIALSYKDNDTNQYYVGVMDDDGTNLHNIYAGEFPAASGANGVRNMPYADNKRILTGDYVIETEPDLDRCDITKTKALPIKYPEEITKNSMFVRRWTEIIIAPDNIHIGWTSTASINGLATAINFIGRLEKNSTGDGYEINNATIISDLSFVHEVDGKPGILEPIEYIHGGEIKQFTKGGTKITLAGAVKQGMSRSIVQDLQSNTTYALSKEPGYEETTIISPDGKLGIAMSTRFSPKTNCAILGLVPRPNSVFTLMGMNRYAYAYSVTKVRTDRVGNIGPALFDIAKAKTGDINYHGHDLHDQSENQAWVFRSPLSWHRSSTRAIWQERHRVTKDNRIRKVVIETDSSKTSYVPGKPEEVKETPDKMPYSLPLTKLKNVPSLFFNGTFIGVKGSMHCNRQLNYIHTTYDNYSVDGKIFSNGFENFDLDAKTGEVTYTANVNLFGDDTGSMNFKLVLSKDNDLIKEKSYGYASYHDKTVKVDDMLE